jgi:hypothetical protein
VRAGRGGGEPAGGSRAPFVSSPAAHGRSPWALGDRLAPRSGSRRDCCRWRACGEGVRRRRCSPPHADDGGSPSSAGATTGHRTPCASCADAGENASPVTPSSMLATVATEPSPATATPAPTAATRSGSGGALARGGAAPHSRRLPVPDASAPSNAVMSASSGGGAPRRSASQKAAQRSQGTSTAPAPKRQRAPAAAASPSRAASSTRRFAGASAAGTRGRARPPRGRAPPPELDDERVTGCAARGERAGHAGPSTPTRRSNPRPPSGGSRRGARRARARRSARPRDQPAARRSRRRTRALCGPSSASARARLWSVSGRAPE